LRALAVVLNGHSLAEEVVLYPALAKSGEKGHAGLAYTEQTTTKMQMAELERIDPRDEAWLDKLEHIRGAVLHHIFEEEGTWVPELKAQYDDQAFRYGLDVEPPPPGVVAPAPLVSVVEPAPVVPVVPATPDVAPALSGLVWADAPPTLPAVDVCPAVEPVADMPVVAGSVAAGEVCSEAVVSPSRLASLEHAVTDSAKPATKVQTL
jgi:hypothetical protein